MSAGGAFAVVRSWMADKLMAPKAVIDALERFIADKSVSFREMADLPAHTIIGRDNVLAGTPQALTLSGGMDFTGTGGIEIAHHGVTNDKFRQSAGLSLVGNATNATADVADITAASDGQVMRRSGTAIAFGAVNLASANAITGNLPVANLNSGTGATSSTFWCGDATWKAITATGTVTHTAGSLTSGQLIVGNGSADIKVGDLSGDVSTAGGTATTIGALKIATGMIQASAVTEAKIGLSNVTTNDVTTSAHGFAPKAPNDATKFLDGTGAYSVPSGSAGLPWFNVKTYGATGNGSTDDTSAINLAIAALNSAGAGVLYFPAGTYKTTTALTAITAVGTVLGDGMDGDAQHTTTQGAASLVTCTSATAALFTVNGKNVQFRNVGLKNTAGSTPSAGAGITVTSSNYDQKVDYDAVSVVGFYIDIDVQVGNLWTMRNCFLDGAVLYALKVQNTVNADVGDWSISDSAFYSINHNGTAAIHIASSGGAKISTIKINGSGVTGTAFTNGIEVVGGTTPPTSILLITNSSIENYTGNGINVSGAWPEVSLTGLQFGQYSNGTGHAISISSSSNVIIDDILLVADTGTPTAIVLSAVTKCAVGTLVNNGFGTLISGTPTQDNTGGVGSGVQITGVPSVGDVPVATSGAAAAWGPKQAPLTLTTTGTTGAATLTGATLNIPQYSPPGATWLPLTTGAEPPVFVTNGAGILITVSYAP